MMKFLQKLGKSLMLPVAVLPICGLLMGIGYYLCPSHHAGRHGRGPGTESSASCWSRPAAP